MVNMWARIEDNVVVELTEIDPTDRFHHTLIWLPCDKSVQPGWRHTSGLLAPPVVPTEHRYRTQIAAINQACEAAITAGFTSEALGAPHFYSSQLDDQLNLTGAVLRGLDMPYACRDEQGVKEFRLHTAEQLRQVGDDFTLYKLQLLQHANALKQQLDAALDDGDLSALEAISWEAPQP